MDNQQTTIGIRIINWALGIVTLLHFLAGVYYPLWTFRKGGAYLNSSIIGTLLFAKCLALPDHAWADSLVKYRLSITWLGYIAYIGLIVHYYLISRY